MPTLKAWNQSRAEVLRGTETILENVTVYKMKVVGRAKIQKRELKLWQPLKMAKVNEEEGKGASISDEIFKRDSNPNEILAQLKNSSPIPVTLISTRDCFVHDLHVKETLLDILHGKQRKAIIKREYFFTPETIPENYRQVVGMMYPLESKAEVMRVGVITYENFYTEEEMRNMEIHIEETEKKSLSNRFLPMTAQKTFSGNTLKRTKFFFGYRYMWTKTQLLEPLSNVAAGVRADVS